MDGPKPTLADFTKTLAIVLLAEYLVVAVAHAASLALADAAPAAALCAKVASLWLFAGMLVIDLCTAAGACAMLRTENAVYARTSLAMTSALAVIMAASYLNDRIAFHAGAAALTALMIALIVRTADGKFLRPNPR